MDATTFDRLWIARAEVVSTSLVGETVRVIPDAKQSWPQLDLSNATATWDSAVNGWLSETDEMFTGPLHPGTPTFEVILAWLTDVIGRYPHPNRDWGRVFMSCHAHRRLCEQLAAPASKNGWPTIEGIEIRSYLHTEIRTGREDVDRAALQYCGGDIETVWLPPEMIGRQAWKLFQVLRADGMPASSAFESARLLPGEV